jgi:hypothetical protein
MLNPLRHLKGKLNHICLPQTQIMRAVLIANSLTPAPTSLGQDSSLSVEDIRALGSRKAELDERRYHRFEFELMVHSQQAAFGLPSTVFDQLSAHERKLSHTVASFANQLSTRQQLYLQLAIRAKINQEYPDWQRLHLTPDSPFKVEMEVVPALTSSARIHELKALPKKGVMREALKAKDL